MPAFCTTLFHTSELRGLECNSAQRAAVRTVFSGLRQGNVRGGLQGKLYKALTENRTCTWGDLLETRVTMFREDLSPMPPTWHFSDDLHQIWPLASKGLSVSSLISLLNRGPTPGAPPHGITRLSSGLVFLAVWKQGTHYATIPIARIYGLESKFHLGLMWTPRFGLG